jgi:DMSO reductase anchor subunit
MGFSLVTVYATAQIYASLKPIRQWNNAYVPLVYPGLAFASGAVLLNALAALFADPQGGMALLALVALGVGYGTKELYWRHIDNSAPRSTAESATGLGQFGSVRLLDAPHTEENYLQKEMGFRIARKHARRLRNIVRVLGFAVPAAAVAIGWAGADWLHATLGLVAVVCLAAGLLIERWLFFAEATHTVTLYYGAESA